MALTDRQILLLSMMDNEELHDTLMADMKRPQPHENFYVVIGIGMFIAIFGFLLVFAAIGVKVTFWP